MYAIFARAKSTVPSPPPPPPPSRLGRRVLISFREKLIYRSSKKLRGSSSVRGKKRGRRLSNISENSVLFDKILLFSLRSSFFPSRSFIGIGPTCPDYVIDDLDRPHKPIDKSFRALDRRSSDTQYVRIEAPIRT